MVTERLKRSWCTNYRQLRKKQNACFLLIIKDNRKTNRRDLIESI
jgi:hypothetical protein